MQFLHDLEVLPTDLRVLLLKNINSLSAVDIELLHGWLCSVVPKVHRRASEQEAINIAIRRYTILKVCVMRCCSSVCACVYYSVFCV